MIAGTLPPQFYCPLPRRRGIFYAALLTVFGLALFTTYYLTKDGGFWFTLDTEIYFLFNDRLQPGTLFTKLVAIANLRVFDMAILSAMGLLYYHYYRRANRPERRKMLCLGLTMLLMAVVIKQCGRLLPVAHASPSIFFEFVGVRLRDLTDLPAKDCSSNSFPGDHGMMLMIFAAFMLRYFGPRAFLAACLFAAFFSLPRIACGAHWFSDVYAGSLSIICIFLSWYLLTPASDAVAAFLYKVLPAKPFVE